MNPISKFLKVWTKGLGLSISEEMAYKASFVLMIVSIAFGDIVGPLVSYALYSVTNGIPGWTLMQLILLQGVSIFAFGVWHAFLGGISWVTADMAEEGEFDIALLKPFNTIGYLATRGIDFHGITEPIVGMVLIIFVIIKLNLFGWAVLPFVYLLFLACVFMFSISVLMAALSMIFIRIWALRNVIEVVGMVSSYPTNVYAPAIRLFISFIVPAAIAGYWPAAVLVGKESVSMLPMVTLPVAGFLVFSLWLWNFALKRYQSAGG
jgi:ABC-2 type transport system permease protein